MRESVERGLDHEGVLPGPLHLTRRAATYHVRASGYKQSLQSRGLVFAYALAVAEENASGGRIVTAPTCGSSGVVPAVLYHLQRAAVSPTHASTARWPRPACSATSSNTTPRFRAPRWVARARWASPAPWRPPQPTSFSEAAPRRSSMPPKWGSEHHLGMTCDPVCGLVQIPCIERNAYAAARALDANLYSAFTDGGHRVLVRPRGRGDETDGARPSLDLQGDGRGRTGTGVRSRQVTMRGRNSVESSAPLPCPEKINPFGGNTSCTARAGKTPSRSCRNRADPLNSSSAVMP